MLWIVVGSIVSLLLFWGLVRILRTTAYSLGDKVFLITGGSRGLGLVLARQVCAHGGKVALLARDLDELSRARDDAARHGGEAIAVQCDLLETDQIQSAFEKTLQHFGRIDVLINNAGIIQVGPFGHMQKEDFELAMRLHFWAPYEFTMRAIPEMRKEGGGRIVNISSIGGKVAVPHLAPYSASKFALTGFSDALRAELARDNIRITTVAPGLMRTGSHINAKFKGRHDAEFAWFSVSSGMPLISMKAERAARKILAACRRGQSSLTLTVAAKALVVGNSLTPNLVGAVMKLVSRFLPERATAAAGDELRPGRESSARGIVPRWMTALADRASARNNETPPPQGRT